MEKEVDMIQGVLMKDTHNDFLSKEFLFIFDDAFSIGTGLECAGFAGPVRWLWALSSSAKTRNKKDRWGLARCRSDA